MFIVDINNLNQTQSKNKFFIRQERTSLPNLNKTVNFGQFKFDISSKSLKKSFLFPDSFYFIKSGKKILGMILPKLAQKDLSNVTPLNKDFLTCGMMSREFKEDLLRMAKTLSIDHPDASVLANKMTVESSDSKFIILSRLLGMDYTPSLEENIGNIPIADISDYFKIPNIEVPKSEDLLKGDNLKKYIETGNIEDKPDFIIDNLPNISGAVDNLNIPDIKSNMSDLKDHVIDIWHNFWEN